MLFRSVGCAKCNKTGYLDRIGIFEVLIIDEDIKELVTNGKSSLEIRRKAIENGFEPMVLDGIRKVLDGTTTLDEINNKLVLY